MKPKFNIPLQASPQEIEALVRMYAERIYRQPYLEVDAPVATWLKWNVARLSELMVLLDKPK